MSSKVHSLILQFEQLSKQQSGRNCDDDDLSPGKSAADQLEALQAKLATFTNDEFSDNNQLISLIDMLIDLQEIPEYDSNARTKKLECLSEIKLCRDRLKAIVQQNGIKPIIKKEKHVAFAEEDVQNDIKPIIKKEKHVAFVDEEKNEIIENNEETTSFQQLESKSEIIEEILLKLDYLQSLFTSLNPFDVYRIETLQEELLDTKRRLDAIQDADVSDVKSDIENMLLLLNDYQNVDDNDAVIEEFDKYANDINEDEEKDFEVLAYLNDLEKQIDGYKKLVVRLQPDEVNRSDVLKKALHDVRTELAGLNATSIELINRKNTTIDLIDDVMLMINNKVNNL